MRRRYRATHFSRPRPLTEIETLPSSGSHVGRYHVLGEIASGCFGPLFELRAETEVTGMSGLGRLIVLPAELSPEAEQDISEAAWDSMELRHESLLCVADVVFGKGWLVLVHDYSEGSLLRSLRRRAEERHTGFPIGVATRIVLDLLDGLEQNRAVCDSAGVPWRPGGIGEASLYLCGDGRTRALDGQLMAVLTRAGLSDPRRGSVGFPPPELLDAEQTPDERADVFAAAVVFWQLLTGAALSSEQGSEPRPKVPKLSLALPKGSPLVPTTVARVIDAALELDPAKRPRSIAELRRALGAVKAATYAEVIDFTDALLHRESTLFRLDLLPGPKLSDELRNGPPKESQRGAVAKPGSSRGATEAARARNLSADFAPRPSSLQPSAHTSAGQARAVVSKRPTPNTGVSESASKPATAPKTAGVAATGAFRGGSASSGAATAGGFVSAVRVTTAGALRGTTKQGGGTQTANADLSARQAKARSSMPTLLGLNPPGIGITSVALAQAEPSTSRSVLGAASAAKAAQAQRSEPRLSVPGSLRSSAAEIKAPEPSAPQAQSSESRLSVPGSLRSGAAEIRAPEPSAPQAQSSESRLSVPGSLRSGAAEIETLEPSAAQAQGSESRLSASQLFPSSSGEVSRSESRVSIPETFPSNSVEAGALEPSHPNPEPPPPDPGPQEAHAGPRVIQVSLRGLVIMGTIGAGATIAVAALTAVLVQNVSTKDSATAAGAAVAAPADSSISAPVASSRQAAPPASAPRSVEPKDKSSEPSVEPAASAPVPTPSGSAVSVDASPEPTNSAVPGPASGRPTQWRPPSRRASGAEPRKYTPARL